jgi:propionyl-CoA carboxylase alpha chain
MVPGLDKPLPILKSKSSCKRNLFLIKASAGGGKGMRVVENEEEFESQMKRAISEAINALVMVLFFIEIRGHHAISKFKLWLTVMEYLVFIRKRMQHTTSPSKVIEEAPSSVLTPELRKKMGEAAVLVAKSCDYLAGTVEFY